MEKIAYWEQQQAIFTKTHTRNKQFYINSLKPYQVSVKVLPNIKKSQCPMSKYPQ